MSYFFLYKAFSEKIWFVCGEAFGWYMTSILARYLFIYLTGFFPNLYLDDQLAQQIIKAAGNVSGVLTVKTESWSSKDNVTHTSEKTETWGGRRHNTACIIYSLFILTVLVLAQHYNNCSLVLTLHFGLTKISYENFLSKTLENFSFLSMLLSLYQANIYSFIS